MPIDKDRLVAAIIGAFLDKTRPDVFDGWLDLNKEFLESVTIDGSLDLPKLADAIIAHYHEASAQP